MKSNKEGWKDVFPVIEELVEYQKNKVLTMGRRFVPSLTPEDMLQPNDYSELENNPEFRYEEGIMAGILMAQMAMQSQYKQNPSNNQQKG